jgi:hypothetical protein
VVDWTSSIHDKRPQRILICAPSNAALDEIMTRLILSPSEGGGILNSEGQRYTPTVRSSLTFKMSQLLENALLLGYSCWIPWL